MTVTDTGKGMDEVTRERAFEPFFTTKDAGRGTGLGLSIVFGIVRQHNGVIDLASEPGKGTNFRIYFELKAEQEKSAAPVELKLPVGGTETILVAEDDVNVRSFVRMMLEEYGYTIIDAADGEEALRLFGEHCDTVQLLFLDVVMPRKNGREVYEEICKIHPEIPVLFTSGYPADVLFESGFIGKGVHFLLKPLIPNVLLQSVRDALAR
jgi:CheY-like chemotaxis protein